jgi:septal ring factor EnvC (AmiA/AmiB activator)
MAYTFDSLGYAKRLRGGGVPQDQAEAHAEAARDFIMAELVTKADLLATKQDLQTESRSLTAELRASIAELRTELRSSIAEVRTSIAEVRGSVETQSLRLTVRLGAMLAVSIGALAAIMKLTQ